MAWTAADIPDLSGSTAVVTGANSGLGLECAKALAARGAHVVMAMRDQQRAEVAVASLREAQPDASLEPIALDLGSQANVKEVGAALAAAHPSIDMLITNAGVMATPEGRTPDGYETQLGINHLGHWTLTSLLLPSILRAPAGRVVTVTSTARHRGGTLDPANPFLEGTYDPWLAYGNSKIANAHFAYGLQHQFAQAGVAAKAFSAHPGLSQTDLQHRTVREGGAGSAGPFFERLTDRTGMPAWRGALPLLRAATEPGIEAFGLYGPRWVNSGNAVRLAFLSEGSYQRAVPTLWRVSEDLTGVRVNVAEALAAL